MNGLTVDGGAVWALTANRLARIDIATGSLSTADISARQIFPVDLWTSADRFVVIAEEDSVEGKPPVQVLH